MFRIVGGMMLIAGCVATQGYEREKARAVTSRVVEVHSLGGGYDGLPLWENGWDDPMGGMEAALPEIQATKPNVVDEELGASSSPQTDSPPPPVWHDSYEDAYREARRTGKPILVYWGANSCPNCPALEAKFESQFVKHELKNWVCAHFLMDEQPEELARAERWQKRVTGSTSFTVPKIWVVWMPSNRYKTLKIGDTANDLMNTLVASRTEK